MLKLRLKKIGRKNQPAYKLVIMKSAARRNGLPIDELGYYNPITKKLHLKTKKILKWFEYGVKPTKTVFNLLKKANIIN